METHLLYQQGYQNYSLSFIDIGGSSSIRSGDWICLNCNNFNYSFRNLCKIQYNTGNRCKQQTKNKNMQMESIVNMMKTNIHLNKSFDKNCQSNQQSIKKNWFKNGSETQLFCNVLFPFVSEILKDSQSQIVSVKQNKIFQQTNTEASDEDFSHLQSNFSQGSQSMCQQQSLCFNEIDSYLMNILND